MNVMLVFEQVSQAVGQLKASIGWRAMIAGKSVHKLSVFCWIGGFLLDLEILSVDDLSPKTVQQQCKLSN